MKKIAVLLLVCFIGLNAMKPGDSDPAFQSKLTGLKTSLVQLKTKLDELNKKLLMLRDKIRNPKIQQTQPPEPVEPIITPKTETLTQPPALLRSDLQKDPTEAAEVVENILGISERELVKLSKEEPKNFAEFLRKKSENGREIYYLNPKEPKDPKAPKLPEVRVGNYSEPTGEDLDKRVEARKKQLEGQPKEKTSFSIVYQSDKKCIPYVDTGNMQADPAYKNALFMAASNLNGLETISADDYDSETKVKLVDAYYGDPTQGPSVAIATVAGTIFRTYFRNCKEYQKNPEKWPQFVGDLDREANYLKNFGIPTRNGYVTSISAENVEQLSADNAFSKFTYGLQEGVQVTYTGLDYYYQHQRFDDPTQKVSQVYVAALDIGQTSSPFYQKLYDTNSPDAEKQQILDVAQKILEMSYDAVIKEAFAQGITTVVLTRIGGGAFKNPPEMIDAAIKGALEKNKEILKMGGIKIVLNAFGKPNESMMELTKKFGGTVTEFGNGKKITTTYPAKITE